jgi:hypothetical protein
MRHGNDKARLLPQAPGVTRTIMLDDIRRVIVEIYRQSNETKPQAREIARVITLYPESHHL